MSQRNLLACQLADESVAVPVERVIGVVEGAVVTPLPWSAPAFEGLVEAFGQVMPQVSLARLLSLRASEGGILVIVSDRGGSLALRVAHVTGMIAVEEEALASTTARARARNPLYTGEVPQPGGATYVLDLDLLATSDELELSGPTGAVILPEAAPPEVEAAPEEAWLPLLLLEIAGHKYAIPSEAVVELAVPGATHPMPGAPEWILGLVDVRGAPIVAVSTAALLGREAGPAEVCLIADLGDGLQIGLVVDRAARIERVPPAQIFPMPQTMAGVRGYFVLGEEEIVGVIDPQQLVAQVEPTLRDAVPRRPPEATDAAPESDGRSRQLLTMRVGSGLYGVTLERIERIEAAVQLTPLPDTIQYFDGMADVGDAVVPVVDLRRQRGGAVAAFDTTERPPCILTMIEGAMTGILVDQVLSILDVPPERFEAVTEASRLPISHVVAFEDRLYSVLTLDRLLPAM